MNTNFLISNQHLGVGLASLVAFLGVILLIRLNGLRSLSKMSSFDFTITVATSTIVASIATRSISLPTGLIAMGSLFLLQALISHFRKNTKLDKYVDNSPMLLVKNGKHIDDNLEKSKVTKDDLAAKLREANVLQLDKVQAVVFESTGDISVLHGDSEIEDSIMRGVPGWVD